MADNSTTTTGPAPVYKANMPGIKTFAGRLNSMGYQGDVLLQKFYAATESGDSALVAEKAAKIEALAKKVGFEGDLWGATPVSKAPAAPARSNLADTSTMKELGKATWNGLADAVTGIARAPQVLHDAAGAIYTGLGGQQSPEDREHSQNLNSVFKGLGDSVAHFMDTHLKADVDKTGVYDQGLFNKDESGDWHYNGLQGAAHSIGSSLGFVASMIGPGLAAKGARAIGVGTSALRAAKAAGDVERVAELVKSAQGTERAMRYVGGVVSQVEPMYQDALEATGDSHKAAVFTAAVAPVIAAIDAFTGVEALAGGSARRALSKQLVKETIGRMGEEITEASMQPVVKTFAEKWLSKAALKERGLEGLKQMATEGGTEDVQEGYQMLVERVFDKASGDTKLADHGGATDARLLNSLVLGGMLGGPMGAVFHQMGATHPTAFRLLHDAYTSEGKVGLQAAVDDLKAGTLPFARQQAGGLTDDNVDQAIGFDTQLDKMASVITSFKNPYQVDPKTQFQFYDLNYNHLPAQQQTLSDLQTQHDNLTADQPVDTDGSPLDPVVAASQAAQMAPQLADQQHRVAYLEGVRDRLTQQGKYQDWAKGYDQIGKYQPGDRVVGPDQDSRSQNDGTVTAISEDGQTLTVQVPAQKADEQPASVTIKAAEAKPYQAPGAVTNQASTNPDVADAEVGEVAVADNLNDGFMPVRRNETGEAHVDTPLQSGSRVILADDPTKSYPVEVEGNTITIPHPDGPLTGTLADLTDRQNPRRVLGTYSPSLAVRKQAYARQQAAANDELDKLRKKLPVATTTALDLMNERELTAHYEALKGDKSAGDERKYVEHIADQHGWPVTAPTPSPAAQVEHAQDATAVDTPTGSDAVVDAGEEVIDDTLWKQIIDTDQIPDEVIGDIAWRSMENQQLTERQQILADGFTEADNQVYHDAIIAYAEFQLNLLTDEQIQPTPTDIDSAGSPGGRAGKDSQNGQVGTTAESTSALPRPTGQIQPELADVATLRPANEGRPADASANSDQNLEHPNPGRDFANPPQSAPATPEELATGADGERLVQRSLAQQRTARRKQGAKSAVADAELVDPYEQQRKADAAASSNPSDEEIDQAAQRAHGNKSGQNRSGRQAPQPDLVAALGVDPDEVDITPAEPIYIGPQVEGAASVGTKVRVLLSGGKETIGVIRGKNADGDIVIRRPNRQGTAEEDFPHTPGSILALSGKPIAIDPDLPLPAEESTTNVSEVKVGDQVMAPGVVGGQVLADVLAVNDDGTARVRVVLSGSERTVPMAKLSRPAATEITRVKNILNERKGRIAFQQTAEPSTVLPATPVEVLSDWIGRLQRAFPRIRVELLPGEEMSARFGDDIRGAVEKGIVYINRDTATTDTPLHEYGHIYNAVLKKYYPQLYQRGLDLIVGTIYETSVRRSHPHLTSDETVREEALAQAIGEKGAALPTSTMVQRFMTWAKLAMRRIGDALRFPLSMETTLDNYLAARAQELTSGIQLSGVNSEQISGPGIQRQASGSSQFVTLPSVIDETTLASGNLTEPECRVLLGYDVSYNSQTDSYTRHTVDKTAQAAAIRQSRANLEKQGKLVGFVNQHLNILIPDNLLRLAFGIDSAFYTQWQTLQEQQQRMVAGLNIATHDFARQAYDTLKGRSTYRGATSWDGVEKWDVSGQVNGQAQTLALPVDVIVDMAGQYRTTLIQYGHIDPNWQAKVTNGQQETMLFEVPNPDNPRSPISVELTKAELRAIEDRVFYQDGDTSAVMQAWQQYAAAQLPTINRIYALINGKPIGRTNWYYPLSVAESEQQLNQRSIQAFVDDAGLLKSRQGIPRKLRANGMLQATARYGHQAANFVQLAALWHNLDRLLVNQQDTFDSDPALHPLRDALSRLKTAYQTPDIAHNQSKIETSSGSVDLAKLLRIATLSRFAFNIAIPLKQITGYTSAIGNGAIRDEFLLGREGMGYLATIAESYWLIGRGSKEGSYSGGQTSFDDTLDELRSVQHPDAQVLLWRAQGTAHPDIHFDDWGSVSHEGKLNWAFEKMRYYSEEYGLSISQRADSAVVRAFYQAAKAQVRADQSSLSEQEVREQAVPLTKRALYYSNQTFDKTDKAPLQLDGHFLQRIISLYKGQNFKVYNTMATRALELGAAPPTQRPVARKRLAKAIGVNAVLAPLMTLGVDVLVSFIRQLPAPEEEKELPVEQVVSKYTGEALSLILQSVPGNPGIEFASWLAYKLGNPNTRRTPLEANPLATLADFGQSVGQLVATLANDYRSEETMQRAQIRLTQQILRAGGAVTGVPQEAIRLANHAISRLLPEDKPAPPSRHRHQHDRGHRSAREINYGIEYLTDTEEEQPHPRRR